MANHAYPDQRHLFGHHRRGYRSSPGRWDPAYWNPLTNSVWRTNCLYDKSLSNGKNRYRSITKAYGLDCSYRLDFLVADSVVVEIKAIEALLPIHQAQLLCYLKLGGWKLGLVINFHAPLLREGIKRVVLGLEEVPKSTTSKA